MFPVLPIPAPFSTQNLDVFRVNNVREHGARLPMMQACVHKAWHDRVHVGSLGRQCADVPGHDVARDAEAPVPRIAARMPQSPAQPMITSQHTKLCVDSDATNVVPIPKPDNARQRLYRSARNVKLRTWLGSCGTIQGEGLSSIVG